MTCPCGADGKGPCASSCTGHEHAFAEIVRKREGQSVDSYSTCACGAIMHVYTYSPTSIRHETLHPRGSWTDGYANGLRHGVDLLARAQSDPNITITTSP